MYAVKFTVFYVIAALAAMAFASPVPVAVPGALAAPDVLARDPLPEVEAADVDRRFCRKSAEECL